MPEVWHLGLLHASRLFFHRPEVRALRFQSRLAGLRYLITNAAHIVRCQGIHYAPVEGHGIVSASGTGFLEDEEGIGGVRESFRSINFQLVLRTRTSDIIPGTEELLYSL